MVRYSRNGHNGEHIGKWEMGETGVNFGSLTKKLWVLMFVGPKWTFRETTFLHVLQPYMYCISSRNCGAGRHHAGLCGISSLLHSVNLILFTVLLIHLILHISPRHSHHLLSHHLSLHSHFTPDLKLISFTNPFLHSHSYSFQTDFTDLNLY